LPDVEAIFVPWGGGGLACGIAAAIRGAERNIPVIACEIETSAPLTAARAAGAPQLLDYQPSFVDGIGGRTLLAEMWPLAQQLISGTRVVPIAAVAAAIQLLAERHRVIAEGAGATAVAAALAERRLGEPSWSKIACIVSGGNLDTANLTTILAGQVP
jgi:threonine dehydratase